MSFETGTSPQALAATDLGESILFEGQGQNYGEDNATGAAILYDELTDTLSLDFGSVQSSGPNQNAVFSAIDGDLSLFGGNGFGEKVDVTPVPVPTSALLLMSGAFAIFGVSMGRLNDAQ